LYVAGTFVAVRVYGAQSGWRALLSLVFVCLVLAVLEAFFAEFEPDQSG